MAVVAFSAAAGGDQHYAAGAVTVLAIIVGALFWRLLGAGRKRKAAELEYWEHKRRRAVATIAELLDAAKNHEGGVGHLPAASKVFRAIFDEFEDALVTKEPLAVPEDGARLREMKELLRTALGFEINEALRSKDVGKVEALASLGQQARRHFDRTICSDELREAAQFLRARGALRREHVWRLLGFVDRESMTWLGIGLVIKILSQMPQPIRMIYVSATVTAAARGEDGFKEFQAAAAVSCWLFVAEKLLQFGGRITMFRGEQLFTFRLKKEVYAACLRQDLEFFDTHRSGEIQLRLDGDTKEVCQKVLYFPVRFVQFAFFLVFNIITLISTCKWLVLATLSALPLSIFGNVVLMKRMRRFYDRMQRRAEVSASQTQEVLSNIRTVRSFAKEPYELLRYTRNQEYEARIMSTVNLLQGMMQPILHAITEVSFFIGLYYGGLLIMRGMLASGEVLTLVQGTQACTGVLMDLFDTLPEIAKAGKPASRICELLEKPSLIEVETPCGDSSLQQQGKELLTITHGRLELENVHFSYATRRHIKVLRGISFTAPSGQLCALVGSTGCGKSTIGHLLLRFYAPTGGRVLIDGRPLEDYHPHQLRRQIGVVAQEPLLFGASIRRNLLYGVSASDASEVDDSQLRQCCELANAWEFVSRLPEGLSTEVGEHGCQLSGGQKQRLAIARAVLKQPQVLLLDEATSALDHDSEQVVQRALDEVVKASSCTTIVIAHRLATIRNAKKIVAIENGVVLEEGSPGELAAKPGGLYARLLRAQDCGVRPCSPVRSWRNGNTNGLNGRGRSSSDHREEQLRLASKLERIEEELLRRGHLASASGGDETPKDEVAQLLSEVRGMVAEWLYDGKD